MKALLATLLIPCSVFANPFSAQKPVVCDNSEEVMNQLLNNFKEGVVFIGPQKDSIIMITISAETGSWTLVETRNETKTLCVLGLGEGFKFNSDILKQMKVIK